MWPIEFEGSAFRRQKKTSTESDGAHQSLKKRGSLYAPKKIKKNQQTNVSKVAATIESRYPTD